MMNARAYFLYDPHKKLLVTPFGMHPQNILFDFYYRSYFIWHFHIIFYMPVHLPYLIIDYVRSYTELHTASIQYI